MATAQQRTSRQQRTSAPAPPARHFDFTAAMRCVCLDMIQRLPELDHIDLGRVAIAFRQTRKAVRHGLQASLTPMRFEGGSRHSVRRGKVWTVQQVLDDQGREMLYILNFYLPRFLEQPLREKLVTVLHELWHISPQFDGDLRRHEGRCYAHSHSQQEYDAAMGVLADRWLAAHPPENVYSFLQHNFHELASRHGPICGLHIATPKIIPAT